MNMGTIRIDDVKVGDRRREDMGDLDGLARSIAQYGLMQPIVIDAWNNLVAGHRRLQACKRLGWESIPYREVGDVSGITLREMELRENLDRKDFTELELSKNMAALAETVGERLRNDFQSRSDEKSKMGRPSKPDSQAAISRETGIPQATISEAIAHAEAVKRYPILETVPKGKAIQIA